MKMSKRILSVLLSASIILGLMFTVPMTVGAEEIIPERTKDAPLPIGATSLIEEVGAQEDEVLQKDGFSYIVVDNKAVITDYEENPPLWYDLVIPEYIDSYPVVEIGKEAFIGIHANTVTFPKTLVYIGAYAFKNSSLKEINFSEGLVYIGEEAFMNNSRLNNLKLPDGLVYIGTRAFNACSGLESFSAPDSLRFVGFRAFDQTRWYAKKSNTYLYVGKVFYELKGCPDGIPYMTFREDTKALAEGACKGFHNMKKIKLPQGLEVIGDLALYDTFVENLEIPSSVNYIGEGALANNMWLKNVTVSEDNKFYTSEDNIIYDKEKTGIVYYPMTKTEESLTLGENIEFIDSYAFFGAKFSQINLHKNLYYIGNYAFSECKSLKEIYIPNSVVRIGVGAFEKCEALENVSLPVYLQYIDDRTFCSCYSLKEVKIPYYCGYLGEYAFGGCKNLETVYLPDTLYYIGQYGMSKNSIKTFYYGGTEDELFGAFIEMSNQIFLTADIVYNTSVFDVCLGDTNEDVFVNIKDATLVQKKVAKLEELTTVGDCSADVNGDGNVDVRDATAIQKHIAKINTGFGIGEKKEVTVKR